MNHRFYHSVSFAILVLTCSKAASAVVGPTTDFLAQMKSGTITAVTGTFPVTTNVASADAYSVQINTNRGNDPLCQGAGVPSNCTSWQQFVYRSGGQLRLEYILFLYQDASRNEPKCPTTNNLVWSPDGFGNCQLIVDDPTPVPDVPITSLGSFVMTGRTSGGFDTIEFSYGTGILYTFSSPSMFSLSQWWTAAEFNVFGHGSAEMLAFNPNTTIVTKISLALANGAMNAPSCVKGGDTGESNNLTVFPGSCCPISAFAPGISFVETNASSASFPFCLLTDIAAIQSPLM